MTYTVHSQISVYLRRIRYHLILYWSLIELQISPTLKMTYTHVHMYACTHAHTYRHLTHTHTHTHTTLTDSPHCFPLRQLTDLSLKTDEVKCPVHKGNVPLELLVSP